MSTKKTFESFLNSMNENMDLYKIYKRVSGKYSLRKPSYWGDLFNQRASIPLKELSKYSSELDSLEVYTTKELGCHPDYPMQSNFKVQVPQVFVLYCNTERGELGEYYGMSILINTEGATYPRYAAGMPDFEPELHNFANGIPESYLNIVITGAQMLHEKMIAEGQFSWMTQDTGDQIGSEPQNKIDVYMYDNQGNSWKERDYEGYGEFGGMDYYDLVATMNGYTEEDVKTMKGSFKELRQLGIDLAFGKIKTKDKKKKTLFPALVTDPRYNWKRHDFTKEAESDPNQSWYQEPEYDDYEDDYGWDESVTNEAKYNKKKLLKAIKNKDDMFIQLGDGTELIVYNPDSNNDDNADMWHDDVVFAVDQDGEEHEVKYSDIAGISESIVTEKKSKFKVGQYIKSKKDSDSFSGDVYDRTNDVDGSEIFKDSSFEIYEIGKDEVVLWSDADQVEYSIDPDDLKHFVKESVVTEASLSGIEFGNDDDIHPTKFKPLVQSLKKNKVKMEVEKEEGEHGYPEVKLTGKRKDIEKVLADIWGPDSVYDYEDYFESVVTEKFVKDFDKAVLDAETEADILKVYPDAEFYVGKMSHFFGQLEKNLFFKAYYAKYYKQDTGKSIKGDFKITSIYSEKGSRNVNLYVEESAVTENYEVIYSDGVSAMKKFRNEKQALDFMKKTIASNKKLRNIAVYKPGMYSTTQTELVVKFWGDGSYLDNVSKKDPKLAAKKLEESVLNEGRSINKISKEFGETVAKMKDLVKVYVAAEEGSEEKSKLRQQLIDLTAKKKALTKELDDAVAGKNKDVKLVITEGVMSNIHLMASDSKNWDDFLKKFKKDYKKVFQNTPDFMDWLYGMYKDMAPLKAGEKVEESKIQIKRKYTDVHPAKTAGKFAKVRNSMIEAVADGVLTEEEFNNLLKERSVDSKRWMKRNSKFFMVSEDGITLSKFGKRILNGIRPVVSLTLESFVNEFKNSKDI